jgi:hypothetical protein
MNWSEMCSGLAKYVKTFMVFSLMSIVLLTVVIIGHFLRTGFKAFVNFH